MAKSLHKNNRLTVRFTDEQYGRLEKAAKAESTRRAELVEESTLAREIINRGVAEILGDVTPATV